MRYLERILGKIYLRKKVVKDYITESVGGEKESSGYTNTRKQPAI